MTNPTPDFNKDHWNWEAKILIESRLNGRDGGFPAATFYEAGWQHLVEDIGEALEEAFKAGREKGLDEALSKIMTPGHLFSATEAGIRMAITQQIKALKEKEPV